MFYCGDDAEAKLVVKKLIEEVGFEGLDAGPLTRAAPVWNRSRHALDFTRGEIRVWSRNRIQIHATLTGRSSCSEEIRRRRRDDIGLDMRRIQKRVVNRARLHRSQQTLVMTFIECHGRFDVGF